MELALIGISEQMAWAIIACIVMMFFDIITGLMAAWEKKSIDSSKMREGLFHKATLILLIILAWLCEVFVVHVPDLGITVPLVIPSCVIIFSMEVVSITENVAEANPQLKETRLLQLFKISENDNAKRN